MVSVPYKVYIVVDREFSEQLTELERGVPVWIVDTPTNKTVVQHLWKERRATNHLVGITSFDDLGYPPEDILIAELDVIELHHGHYSAVPPYTVLEVVGTQPSTRVKEEMSAYGFDEFHPNSKGFIARRQESSVPR